MINAVSERIRQLLSGVAIMWVTILSHSAVGQEYLVPPEEEADVFSRIERLAPMANSPLDVIRLTNQLLSYKESELGILLSKYVESRDIGRSQRILYLVPILYPLEIQSTVPPDSCVSGDPIRWSYECSKIAIVEDIPFTTMAALPTNAGLSKPEITELVDWCKRFGVRRNERLSPTGNPFEVVDNLDWDRDFETMTLGYRTAQQRLDEHASLRCQASLLAVELIPYKYSERSCIVPKVDFRDPQHIEWQRLRKFGEMITWDGRGYSLSDEAFDLLTRKDGVSDIPESKD
jgi:hypothetical protein